MPFRPRLSALLYLPGISIALLALTLSSCSIFDSASAYFNTYYNAQRVFDQAQNEALAQMESRPGGKNYLAPCQVTAASKTKFASVIEKCSKILQYHPNSALVDDALMMIGKSYYYMDEDRSAERKFREIISAYPDGGLATEAELYLAYVQHRMNLDDDAKQTGLGVVDLAGKNGEDGLVARACLLLGRINEENKEYSVAREFYQQAAAKSETAEQRVSANMLVAEMYNKLGQYEAAEGAYRKAEHAANTYVGEYRGLLGAIRMLDKQGKYDEALQELTSLRSESTYKEFFGEIELETANILRDGGNTDGAIERYRMIDTTYARTEVSARSYLALGEVYEDTLHNYDSAGIAYTKGKGEFSKPELTETLTRKSDRLIKYHRYRSEIDRLDSMQTSWLSNPAADTSGTDSVHLDSTETTFAAAADTARHPSPVPPKMSPDSLRGRLYSAMNELAGLFYVTFGRNDSSLYWYRRVLAEDPEGPHNARALFTLAQISSRDSLAQNLPPADSLYRQIIGRFPKSEFAAESRRLLGLPPVVEERDPAGAMYERIEQMILAGRNEAAVDSLSALVSAYPASSFSPRALYARAWLYEEKLGRPDSALAGYEHLMATYPTSPAAVAVRSRITGVIAMQKAEASQAARADSNAQRKDVPIDDDVRARGAGKHPAGEPLPNPPKPDLAPAPARKDGSPVE